MILCVPLGLLNLQKIKKDVEMLIKLGLWKC